MEMFNLNKLNEVQCKEQYHFEISNRFTALENFDVEIDIKTAWETLERISKFQPERV
jgi:hypothetical protein